MSPAELGRRAAREAREEQEAREQSDVSVTAPATILVVCTGNICRSPMAEQLLSARLAAAGVEARVISAGTRAMVGHDMTPQAAALAVEYGAGGERHSAQLLTAELIAEADLVVTATREHRSAVVSMFPKSTRYAFTLNQLARLTAGAPAEPAPNHPVTITAFVEAIAASRGLTPPPVDAGDDDIEDPYRRSAGVYARAAASIDAAVTTITTGITDFIGKR